MNCICEACRGHISNDELRPVTGAEIRAMFRKHHITIRSFAKRFDLTMKLVRDRRRNGGPWDWPLAVGTMAHERVAKITPLG